MADQLFFNRDTKVFMRRNSMFYEIPVLSDYTYTQAHNTSEITLSEAEDSSGVSRRARQVFNDSFAPSEFGFTTYMRPFLSTAAGTIGTAGRTDTAAAHHAVEEALWDAFVDRTDDLGGVTSDGTDMDVNFSGSNTSTIGTFDLYFVLNWSATSATTVRTYKIAGAALNEASIDFDIDGIATINWSGMGGQLTDEGSTLPYDNDVYASATDLIYEGVNGTNNYIRNKLTTLALTGSGSGPYNATYDVIITGGNITISNNLTFLTPETIGSVNQPLGHVTGTRSVSGNFTAYLDETAGSDSTVELFSDIAEDTTTVTNAFGALFTIGGSSAPKVAIELAQAHLEIPQINTDDVIGVDVNFHGLPSTISGTDEVTIKYTGIAVA